MKKNRLDRREFLKLEAAAMAAAAGGMPTPLAAQNPVTDRSFTELRWNKRPLPILRDRMRRYGRNQRRPRCRNPRRYQGRGQSRA
jgi:hypothetical protein